MDEVEVHDEAVPLVGLSPIIEGTTKAVLFKEAGPERVAIVAKTVGSRRRLAAAFGTSEEGHDDGPLAAGAAQRRQGRVRLHKAVGRAGEIPLTRAGAKVVKGPARFQSVEAALGQGPMFYADIVEGVGSDDGREVAAALDRLREAGRLARDRDGRYSLDASEPGVTGIVGALYPDPNEGA